MFAVGCTATPGSGTTDVALDTGEPTTGASGEPGSSSGSSAADETTAAEVSSSSSGAGDGETGDDTTTTGAEDPSTGEPNLCGNGAIDPGEDCDGETLTVASCSEVDESYTDGDVACDAACKLDISGCQSCEAPAVVPCDDASEDAFHALELGCDSLEGFDPNVAVPLDKERSVVTSVDLGAYRALRRFGSDPTAWVPRAGARALLISTGGLDPVDPQGTLVMPPKSATNGSKNQNGNPDGGLPEGLRIRMIDGGDPAFTVCDGENDCSNTLSDQWSEGNPSSVYDVFSMELTLEVPTGTHGFALDLAYFTAHFPEHNDGYYNDMTVVWAQSERYVGNVAYIADGQGYYRPLSLPALAKAGWMVHNGVTDPGLAGTGYDGPDNKSAGGASSWLTLQGPAVPGESLVLAITIFDFQDMFRDTALLLDNFRWNCAGCQPGVDCGVTVAQ